MVRLGRISYVNMAPVFYRLEPRSRRSTGVPTELNRRLVAGELDLAPISSIEWARNADRLRILPRLCVSLGGRGRLDPARLEAAARAGAARSRSRPESATSVVLTKVLLPEADHVPLGEEADAKLLIGDAALKSAFEDPTPHYDLGRLWLERTGLPMVFAVLAAPEPVAPGHGGARGRARRLRAARARRARAARLRGERALRLPGRVPRALLREAALPLRAARARRAVHVPGDGRATSASSREVPELRFVHEERCAGVSRARRWSSR